MAATTTATTATGALPWVIQMHRAFHRDSFLGKERENCEILETISSPLKLVDLPLES